MKCYFCRDTTESERLKLAHEAQQMSVELEQVREQLAIKNKENLKVIKFYSVSYICPHEQ
jgi:hypothetical protein